MKIFIADNSYKAIDQLSEMFLEYYSELSESECLLPLASKGNELWLDALKRSVGKTSILIIAEFSGKPIGFAHGQLKISPDYLGNLRIGTVAHFYIKKPNRGGDTATLMFTEMINWFKEKNVHSIELQVLKNNYTAEKFWKKMGFEEELNQMRLKF
ncbi:MAG: GNAT family N-acetyltransferase [Bacteroidota bacterium]|jgi:GNAT superfamily N-acetyltransferase